MRVKINIPGISEFNAEFTDEYHLNQFRKHFTLIGSGNITINDVILRPGLKIKDLLDPQKEPSY